MTTTYREGDIVRVEYLSLNYPWTIESQVVGYGGSLVVYKPDTRADDMTFVDWYERHPEDYTISLVKHAALPLPSEPGLYAHSSQPWSVVYRLTTSGVWRTVYETSEVLSLEHITDINSQTPLHRLVVAD